VPAFAHQASVVLSQPELESGTALTAKEMRPVNLAAETVDDEPCSAAHGGLEPMAATTLTDGHVLRRYGPVLRRFRKALDTMYGHRLDRVVLFGSRARGDARPDSDYDAAVFLRDMADRFAEWIGLPTWAPTFATRLARSFTPCPIARFPPTPLMPLGRHRHCRLPDRRRFRSIARARRRSDRSG
jgi:hypothetical protein